MCNRDCFNCVYEDCICDKVTKDEIKAQDRLDKEIEVKGYDLKRRKQYEYNHSERGIARRDRYNSSEKAKEARRKYEQTEKRKESCRKRARMRRNKMLNEDLKGNTNSKRSVKQ